MNLDYREHGKVNIYMTDYLKKILDDRPIKYQGRSITPAANHLFEVEKTTCKLSKGYNQEFHTIVTKLLFLCNLERPNILTGVAFITTRVKETDEVDDKKLGRILNISAAQGTSCTPWYPTVLEL